MAWGALLEVGRLAVGMAKYQPSARCFGPAAGAPERPLRDRPELPLCKSVVERIGLQELHGAILRGASRFVGDLVWSGRIKDRFEYTLHSGVSSALETEVVVRHDASVSAVRSRGTCVGLSRRHWRHGVPAMLPSEARATYAKRRDGNRWRHSPRETPETSRDAESRSLNRG